LSRQIFRETHIHIIDNIKDGVPFHFFFYKKKSEGDLLAGARIKHFNQTQMSPTLQIIAPTLGLKRISQKEGTPTPILHPPVFYG
jgi:hypothetical protein